MALTTTTLSSAVAIADNSIVVASATGFAAGSLVRVDSEWMQVAKSYISGTTIPVARGLDGSATQTHKASANATVGLASDFQAPPAQDVTTIPLKPALPIVSYSASGAIANVGGIHVLNGTSTLTMTMTSPTKDQDGTILILVANGKAAHTVTYTTVGFGNGSTSFDVATFSTSLQGGCILMAMNGIWVVIGNGILGATAATGAPLFA
jgi:hypothetical protein